MVERAMKPKVLFLCTGNSCRSQMAEGWARHLLSDRLEPYSAGIEAHGMNPNAVKVSRNQLLPDEIHYGSFSLQQPRSKLWESTNTLGCRR
jgi:protein-tyrosine-phosphatase